MRYRRPNRVYRIIGKIRSLKWYFNYQTTARDIENVIHQKSNTFAQDMSFVLL